MNNENTIDITTQSQKILNAALKCISEKGYASVSLRNIADEAGVVLSQLHYYYKNKEGLFIEIVKTLSNQYLNEIEDKLQKSKTQPQRISCLIEYFQEMLRKKPELFKMLFDLTSMSIWAASLKEILNDLFKSMAGLIEKYIIKEDSENEKFKQYSAIELSRMMLGTLFGTSIQVILAPEKEDLIDSLSTLKLIF